MFSTVVVGTDDSSTARQAVVVAADVAQNGGGALHIVTAYDPKSVHAEALPDELRYSAGEHPRKHSYVACPNWSGSAGSSRSCTPRRATRSTPSSPSPRASTPT